MKIRKVTIEVEVPWMVHERDLLKVIHVALNEYTDWHHQEQVVKVEESTNTELRR